jgi:hypothetical protein
VFSRNAQSRAQRLSRNARLDLEFRQPDGIYGETLFLLQPSMWTPETERGTTATICAMAAI